MSSEKSERGSCAATEAGVDGDGVVALEGFEAEGEDGEFDVGADAVFVGDVLHDFLDGDGGVEEGGCAAVDVVDDVADVEVALHGYVDVAEAGHGHEVLGVGEGGVALKAVCVVVDEVSGVGILGDGGEADEGGGGQGLYMFGELHCHWVVGCLTFFGEGLVIRGP